MALEGQLDTVVSIVTPENISFEYRIAGPFRRMSAFFIDVALQVTILIMMTILLMIVGFTRLLDPALFEFVMLLTSFAVFWFYGMAFETLWSGQTPGKKIFGLRVISVDGRPINAAQAGLRNLLRYSDVAPLVSLQVFTSEAPPVYLIPSFMVGLLVMTLTTRFQRLGDLAAFTMVIIEEKAWHPALAKIDDGRAAALAEFIPKDFVVNRTMAKALSLYVMRRPYLPSSRRTELANHLALPLIKRFGFLPDTSSDLLLCSLYIKAFYSEREIQTRSQAFGSPVVGSMQGQPSIANAWAGTVPLGSAPLGSAPLGSAPLGSAPLGTVPLGSFPMGAGPVGANQPPAGFAQYAARPVGSYPAAPPVAPPVVANRATPVAPTQLVYPPQGYNTTNNVSPNNVSPIFPSQNTSSNESEGQS